MDTLWNIGSGSLVLNCWHSAFDPQRERVVKRHLWVLLPALPFPLWSQDLLVGVANTISCFVAMDEDFQLILDKRIAHFLVEMDLSRGLPVDIELKCDDITFCQ